MNSKQRIRSRIIFSVILIGAGILAAALYWTQVVNGGTYVAKANEQYVKPNSSLFDRGSIFFSAKDGTNVAAATISSGNLVYMNPLLISDSQTAFDALSQYLKLDKNDFINRASKKNDSYEELASKIDDTLASSIQNLKIPGIGVIKQNWRSYAGNELASHVLGLIGEDKNNSIIQGKYGLESYYEDVLNRPGIGSTVNVFAQLFSGLKESILGNDLHQGDLITTIEPTTERYLETTLGQTASVWHPDEIGGIIMDPSTGEIMAMASLPNYNPNDTSLVKNISVFSNPLVEHVYEFGSIMKPLTMVSAIDDGAVTSTSTYDDTGTMVLNGKKISNYDKKARGIVDMQQILSQSLNIGAATLALKIGKEEFAKYFESFGIGQKTGIDLPNEAAGIINNLKSGRDVEIATAAYGQGIAVSPVSMITALSVLANGGYLVRPHVVKDIQYTDGSNKIVDYVKIGPVLAKKSVNDVTQMLVNVVDSALKNGKIKMDHYSIAAKTGTAQIADHSNGGYYSDRYLHSFFGYFPAYNPKFIVFLYQIYPKGAEYASDTLTDPFDNITKFLINYYNLPPDR